MNPTTRRRSRTARLSRTIHFVAAVLVSLPTAGCYTFAPAPAIPAAGADVRATVTDEEALRISRQTGQLSRVFGGRLEGATKDSIVVSVVTFRAASEIAGSRQLRQAVAISRDGLEALEIRKLSALRSGLAGMLAASAVYLVVDRTIVGGGNGGGNGGGGPVATLVPVFRIPVGR